MTDQMIMDNMFESVINQLYAQDESDCGSSSSSSQASVSISISGEPSNGAVAYHLPLHHRSHIDTGVSTTPLSSSASLISRTTASSHMSPPTPPISPQTAGPRALANIEEQQHADEGRFYGWPAAIVYDVGQASSTPVQKSPLASTEVNINTRTAVAKEVPNRILPTPSDTETTATVTVSDVYVPPGGHFVLRKVPVEARAPRSPVPPIENATSIPLIDEKVKKAQEKRMKKEVAKVRTEELARQLKERAQQAREDTNRISTLSKEKRQKDEPASMWGGVIPGMSL
ncbi:hypothetical protein GGX14DRAFT_443108 [Mycena pura]|uniref:Uncharacterized protein n=1 Tax=Mycena pura TaxID=153505 RepID=A0AAD6VLC0_9AGAR|nr:hypothetical protein GGX14DRAFT_443108 [Mycena pura]